MIANLEFRMCFLVMANVMLCSFCGGQTVADIDGNIYNTVIIGEQVWMAENLKTTKYSDGTNILMVTDSISWSVTGLPAYCWYSNTSLYKDIFGALYNWQAVNTGKLAPEGWHVPTEEEWTDLTDFLGGERIAGGKMKDPGTISIGTGYWFTPNSGATNQSGFTAFGGGTRELDGAFNYLFSYGLWWTSTGDDQGFASYRQLSYNYTDVLKGFLKQQYGMSVRCVKDMQPGLEINVPGKVIKVYPNPAADYVMVDFAEEKFSEASVYNVFGELLLRIDIKGPREKINLLSLPGGVLFLRFTGPGITVHAKLVKN
jgi:uncharacterized protein (TIGR02145 family)